MHGRHYLLEHGRHCLLEHEQHCLLEHRRQSKQTAFHTALRRVTTTAGLPHDKRECTTGG